MSNTNIIGAISCSNATAYTGSFVKLQALGNSDEEVTIPRFLGQLNNKRG